MAGGQRRRTAWVDTAVDATTGNGTQSALDLMQTIDEDESLGMTVTRMLLCLALVPSPLGTVNGVQSFDVGIARQSREAREAGADPEPNDPTDHPLGGWLYRCRFAVLDDPTPGYPIPQVMVNLKTQRKIDRGVITMFLANNTVQGTAFTVRAIGSVRMLVKLP